MKIRSILFVCTGNLCRSPMAKGILRDLVNREGWPDVKIDSAGTYGCEGEPAAPFALRVCQENGVNISDHVAKRIDEKMIENSDLIVVMEDSHLEEIVSTCPDARDKVMLIGSMAEGERIDCIPDPYGKRIEEYRRCFEQIKALVEILHERVIRPAQCQ